MEESQKFIDQNSTESDGFETVHLGFLTRKDTSSDNTKENTLENISKDREIALFIWNFLR